MRKKHVLALIDASKAKEVGKLHAVFHHHDNDADDIEEGDKQSIDESALSQCDKIKQL